MLSRQLSLALLPLSLCTLVLSRIHASRVPEDPFAFPKYRVTFLNGHPVLNETAQRWLQSGLRGGQLEFLDQPWQQEAWETPHLKSIEGSEDQHAAPPAEPVSVDASDFKLEVMKLGPKASYLCLIPPPPDVPVTSNDEPSTDVTPVHTWSLLQPLAGTCLYHRQGWFTYSYCHNSHVRQFHEVSNPQHQRPGEYKPEEDKEWEAYTLGRAPPTLEAGADLTVAEEAALANSVELARGGGSRYLIQRWGDGTFCEKTSRKREIEIQFHCSMTMTDTILFVKETQTCHYVLHIATPRLCGEPGFRSPLDAREESFIRCREILNAEQYEGADRSLPEAEQPIRFPKKKPQSVISPPTLNPSTEDQEQQSEEAKKLKKSTHDLIRQALEKMIVDGEFKPGEVIIEGFGDGDESVVVEFVEADFLNLGGEGEGNDVTEAGQDQKVKRPSLEDVLRAAGLDVKGEKPKAIPKENVDSETQDGTSTNTEKSTDTPVQQVRDEL
ncbi:hypothetical protein C8Q75DRAFT_739995 [Abortiporus biennis]|nr:hypothetical protein C8Q75DRAFT_739995 [Abortiporus biennis]